MTDLVLGSLEEQGSGGRTFFFGRRRHTDVAGILLSERKEMVSARLAWAGVHAGQHHPASAHHISQSTDVEVDLCYLVRGGGVQLKWRLIRGTGVAP